jgi:hypothetical protein
LRTSIWLSALLVLSCLLIAFGLNQVVAGAGGMVQGIVRTRNAMGDYRTVGWANVTATDGLSVRRAIFSSDGGYYVYLSPAGMWTFTVNSPGCKTLTAVIAVSDGSTTKYDFNLEQSGVPIPEFPQYVTPLVTALSLLLVIALLRKSARQKGLN